MAVAPSALWPFSARAAIFDFDGTLADTARLWHQVDVTFLGRRGIECPPDYAERLAALGFAQGARYTIDRFGLPDTVESLCDEWNSMGRDLYRNTVTLRPGAKRYILSLKRQGVPCALATTNDRTVLGSMRHVNIRELFDVRVYGADVGRGKDHPDIYLLAARRLGVSPQDCLVFEDIVPALHSAHSIGMRTCGVHVPDATQDVQTMRRVADFWLDEWTDINL